MNMPIRPFAPARLLVLVSFVLGLLLGGCGSGGDEPSGLEGGTDTGAAAAETAVEDAAPDESVPDVEDESSTPDVSGTDTGEVSIDDAGVDATIADAADTADADEAGSGTTEDASVDALGPMDGAADTTMVTDASAGTPPTWPVGAWLAADPNALGSMALYWTAAADDVAVTGYRLRRDGDVIATLSADARSFTVIGLAAGRAYDFVVEATDASGTYVPGPKIRAQIIPIDPSAKATATRPDVVSNLASDSIFLSTGSDPAQVDVASGTIGARRVALLRGRALDRTGAGVGGARVEIVGHPEYGFTTTRTDGAYDLVVNGGGQLTVSIRKWKHPDVQRTIEVPWRNWVVVPDVVLTDLDSAVTVIDLPSLTSPGVASPMRARTPLERVVRCWSSRLARRRRCAAPMARPPRSRSYRYERPRSR